MADSTRYTKTEKGAEEIRARGKNLRGRTRTMLFLVDPSKTGDELRASASRIGVDADFLDTLVREGYVVPISRAERGSAETVSYTVTKDELARFRAAKAFINDTVVDALGVRALMFTLRLERCATRQDLAKLLADYEKQISKARSEAETQLLVQRAGELIGFG